MKDALGQAGAFAELAQLLGVRVGVELKVSLHHAQLRVLERRAHALLLAHVAV